MARKNGPRLWNDLLASVHEIFESPACIAGGAVRDLNLDVQNKDIDVFINRDFMENDRLVAEELGWGEPIQRGRFSKRYKKGEGKTLKAVLDFNRVGGHIIQLMFAPIQAEDMDEYVRKLLDTFDLDICKQAYYNGGNGNIAYRADEAIRDMDRDTITLSEAGKKGDTTSSYERARSISARISTGDRRFNLVGFEGVEKEKKPEVKKSSFQSMKHMWVDPFVDLGVR